MAYRDIDYSIRVNGDISVPGHSINVGNNTTITNSAITATRFNGTFHGNGANITNIPFSSIVNRPTTLAGYGISDAAKTGHTHSFSSITGRPTTLAGYGITDAADKHHDHNSEYLQLKGGVIDGSLHVNTTSNTDSLSFGRHRLTNKEVVHMGIDDASARFHYSNDEISSRMVFTIENTDIENSDGSRASSNNFTMYSSNTDQFFSIGNNRAWHEGNFSPSDKADANTLSNHINNNAIHKDLGNWDVAQGNSLRSNGNGVMWAEKTGKITLNNANSYTGVNVRGSLEVDSNAVYHAGNLNPSNFVTKSANQSVGNGFSVSGRLLVGNVTNQNGDLIVYNNTGAPTIHLDGNSSGIESAANTKIYVAGNGNARFSETLDARVLKASNTVEAPRVNTDRLNDVRVEDIPKNQSVADATGWGIQTGMEGVAYGGELHVSPGVAYTKSGRRMEITTRTKVVMRPASTSGRRYDALYIKGPSASTEEGEFGYFEGSVGGTAASTLSNRALEDAVILATVRRDANQASITQGHIDNDVRTQAGVTGEKPLYVDADNRNVKVRHTVEASAFHEGGRHLNTIYASLAGGNTFTSNQQFNGRVGIQTSGTLNNNHNSASYALRVGNSNHYVATDGREMLSSGAFRLGANNILALKGTSIEVEASMKASNNATTVRIPAGSTSATWTHNYGNANYAVNLTTDSFERHVRWANKNNNSIVIEIDDATDKEILVDCILMGY